MLISCPTLIITIKLIVLFSFEKERERERTKHELFKKNSKDITVIHLNNSMVKKGEMKDRHAVILDGKISTNDMFSFKPFSLGILVVKVELVAASINDLFVI